MLQKQLIKLNSLHTKHSIIHSYLSALHLLHELKTNNKQNKNLYFNHKVNNFCYLKA